LINNTNKHIFVVYLLLYNTMNNTSYWDCAHKSYGDYLYLISVR